MTTVNKDESPKYSKFIVRIRATNKPVYVTSSEQDAVSFIKKNSSKQLFYERKVIE